MSEQIVERGALIAMDPGGDRDLRNLHLEQPTTPSDQ